MDIIERNAECARKLLEAGAEIVLLRRTIWLLLAENGGTVILNKETVESYPGDDRAIIDSTKQQMSGAQIMCARVSSSPSPAKEG